MNNINKSLEKLTESTFKYFTDPEEWVKAVNEITGGSAIVFDKIGTVIRFKDGGNTVFSHTYESDSAYEKGKKGKKEVGSWLIKQNKGYVRTNYAV